MISLISLFTVSMFIVFPSNVSAKTLADLRRELNEIEKREQDNNNSINMTSAEIQRVQNEIGSIYKEVDTITKDIATATEEIKELNEKIEQKDESTKTLLASLQKTEGNSFYVEYLFGAESIEDFIYRYAITGQLTEYNSDLINKMQSMIKENEEKKVTLANRQKDLESRQKTLTEKISQLTLDKLKLEDVGSSIEDEIRNAKQVIKMYIDAGCGENEDINTCANKLLLPENAPDPIVVTLFGIVNSVIRLP